MNPIQTEACEVRELDLFPETKPVQTTFEPVMIGGHDHEQSDKNGEDRIACLIPFHFIEGDRADRSDDEDDETPAGDFGT